MRLSICVCTYNRARILPYCLDSLTKLKAPADCSAEILVIDNNSSDNTEDVVKRYAAVSPITIRYFYEPRQGISAARNRAVKEARGDYIGFLDDECVARPNWLEIVAADIDECAPPIIGGPYLGALLPGIAPTFWFKKEYGDAYLLGRFERGFQPQYRADIGNMVVHRRVCERLQFDEEFGMKGNALKLGEERLLQELFLNDNSGAMIFYEPRIAVEHFVLPHKMSLPYHARRLIEIGASNYRIGLGDVSLRDVARAVVYLCAAPFRTLLRERRAYPYWQNYIYEIVLPRAMPVIGASIEKLRRRPRHVSAYRDLLNR
jgi:glucosyl-dolichyl phosphate glucuronosyltransferase